MPKATRSAATRPNRPAYARARLAGAVDAGPVGNDTLPVSGIDSSYLESLVGYNTRRASVVIMAVFEQRMAPYALRPVDFSVLSLVRHNPGITSRQVCQVLGLQPPNLVAMVGNLESAGWLRRERDSADGRAVGLYLNTAAEPMMDQAEQTAAQLEIDATSRLTAAERQRLIALLQKVYR